MRNILILSVASMLLFTSCRYVFAKRIHGDGTIQSQNRSIGSFNNIDVSGNIAVYIKQDSMNAVRVEADENLLYYIETVSDGNTLRIHTREGYNLSPSSHIKVFVSNSLFKRLGASGACDIYSENRITSAEPLFIDISGSSEVKLELNTPKIAADISGSCDLLLTGETKDFSVHGSGSTDIKAMDLKAENVDVHISGSGEADVYASVKLNIGVSGSGSVRYKGNPSISQEISGSGSIKKVE
jgi:hypothetical protein